MAEIPQDRAQIIASLKAMFEELMTLSREDAVMNAAHEIWPPHRDLEVAADHIDGAIRALE